MRSGRLLFLSILGLWPRPLAPQDQLPTAVYYVRPEGDDSNPGTAAQPWRHLEWAMTRPFLRPGDTIRAGRGVYRPVLEPNPSRDSLTDDTLIRPVSSGEPGRPITVVAEPGEPVVLSGRVVAASWEPAGGASGVYYHDYSIPTMFPFDQPFQVVEDGRLLFRVSSLEALDSPGRAYVDTARGRLYVWTSDSRPPAAHLMEYGVSTTGIEFQRGARYWRLAGLHLIGFRTAAIQIRDRAGSIELDHLDISYVGAHRPGADLSSGYALATYDTAGGVWVHDSNLHHTLAEAVHISQTGAGGDVYENNDMHDAGGPDWFHETHTGRVLTGPGLILRGSRAVVRGNRFYANGYHGLILESDLRGSEGPAAPGENLVENNVFALNGGNGLYGDGKNGISASRANVIRFNLFDRNNQARHGATGDAELRLAGNFDDTLVYNNTFYADQSSGVLVYSGREAAGAAQGAD
ncbi:MAG: right-handed parallel beta-helix repeat-containing protein, partial [Acidobacteria bacterium]|nr:right-handed parallel beta-helix repeat-containing protein [Acidobacteriota bacterium]